MVFKDGLVVKRLIGQGIGLAVAFAGDEAVFHGLELGFERLHFGIKGR